MARSVRTSDEVMGLLVRLRVGHWVMVGLMWVPLIEILTGRYWMPGWLTWTILPQFVLFYVGVPMLFAFYEKRVARRMRGYLDDHGGLVCPHDAYPLGDDEEMSESGVRVVHCSECGRRFEAGEVRGYWIRVVRPGWWGGVWKESKRRPREWGGRG